ncbi:DUF3352 domain-containing protein [Carboxylicivirga taeanensis]|uniref:DUF3352 domain-containing protein n=1 Tax=Carboxylicivirga taeanensis TaxID=1416875 RepID=UPI003F6DBCD8
MKKGWIIATISVCCLLLAYILYQVSRVKSYDNTQSLAAVPSDAAVIMKGESIDYIYNALFNTIDFKNELGSSALVSESLKEFQYLDSLKVGDGLSAFAHLKELPFYCSLHAQGKESVSQLFIFELPNRKEEAKIQRFIRQMPDLGVTLRERKYNSQTIYELKGKGQHWFASVNNGILLLSQTSLLVEASVREQQNVYSWTNHDDFKQIYKTIGAGSKLNLFVNFDQLPDVLKSILGPGLKRKAKVVGDQSKWAELDIDIDQQAIVLNGFIGANNNGIMSQLLKNAKPQRTQIQDVLPGNTRSYLSVSLESGEDLKKRIASFNAANGEFRKQLSGLELKVGFNPEDDFFNELSGSMALVYTDYNSLQPKANGLLVFKLNSSSRGKEALMEMLRKMNKNALVAKKYTPDDGISYNIYNGFSNDMLELFFQAVLPKVPQKYLSFYEDNLIIADAPILIEQFIYSNMLKTTLSNDKAHQAFRSHFSSRENVFAFCETAHLESFFKESFAPIFGSLNEDQKAALNNFYGFGMQLSGTGPMIYTTSYLQYLPSRESEPRTVWQSLLDSTVNFKPVLVDNHYTQEREVVVQDEANNLYLLSNTGRVLWKKPLDSEILSDVVQIDYYHNNKLQYLFNTRKSIYLLDRNGNHVANFPVRLPSEATNGIAVFDYDNNRNYRLFVACKNRRIYLYNAKGNTVAGWKFNKTDGRVSLPVQHFRTSGKDYIAFADDKRNYICDRRGNIRVKLNKDFIRNANSPYFLQNEDQANDCLVTTCADGRLTKIQLSNGEVTSSELVSAAGNHAFSVFEMNGKSHYLIAEPNKVTCVSNKGKEVFEREFENEINLSVDLYRFSAQNMKFGVTEKSNGHIYLLNENGKTYKGFPLKGKSRFSIGFLKSSASRFNLIVGGAQNYIYNYQVD